MSCGYGAASLTERIYGWSASPQREAAAGLLICTTASDSEGTLGGLVALSEPARLQGLVLSALRRASRCSSDPVCAMRTPERPRGLPARRRLPLLLVRVRDLVREGQPIPRPALPAEPPDGHGRHRARVLRERRCPLIRSQRSGSTSPPARPRRSPSSSDRASTRSRRLRAINPARRENAKELLAAAGLGHTDGARAAAVLRAIAGAKSVHRDLTPVWTMPGNEAKVGHLTGEFHRLVQAARISVTCATYNFEKTSQMWTVLKEASEQPGVVVTVYVDGDKADAEQGQGPTPAGDDLPVRRAAVRQAGRQPRQVHRHRPRGPAAHQRQLLLQRGEPQRRVRPPRPRRRPC